MRNFISKNVFVSQEFSGVKSIIVTLVKLIFLVFYGCYVFLKIFYEYMKTSAKKSLQEIHDILELILYCVVVTGTSAAISIWIYQFGYWFKHGYWKQMPLWNFIDIPLTKLIGLSIMLEHIFDLNLGVVILISFGIATALAKYFISSIKDLHNKYGEVQS